MHGRGDAAGDGDRGVRRRHGWESRWPALPLSLAGGCSPRRVAHAGKGEAGSGEGIEDDLPLDGDESDSDDARGAGRLPWRTTRRLREGIPIYR